jgi:uncharacterized protein (TIGR03437 family)
LAQTSPIQVGQGAPNPEIAEQFIQAYLRTEFSTAVALPPLTQVADYGTGGLRQEFQDAARTGLPFALIRPANPNLSLGPANVVRQVRPPVYAVFNRSSIGSSVAGFPTIDTSDFLFIPPAENTQRLGGSFQTFDKNFAIFVWLEPPLASEGSDAVEMTIADPIYTKWQAVSQQVLGPPTTASLAVTSRFTTRANVQRFIGGAIYTITSGTFSGRTIFVRANVHNLYLTNQGPAGPLGLPVNDEILLPDGRRRQSFEGGTVEFTLNGAVVIKNAVQTISITSDNPLRVTAGQSFPITANLQTASGEQVTDREVFWSSSNGLVATVAGTGPQATLRAIRGGTALITAVSEGRTSRTLTVFVSGVCCAIGEGAPSQAVSQTFTDAVQRNRLTLRLPIPSPVRRLGAGFVQEATLLNGGARVLLAKPDAAPLAFVVTGSLLSAYTGNGGPGGALGYPLSDASAAGVQFFENAALAGAPVQLVTGAILARWRALGSEAGALGLPVSSLQSVLTFTGNLVTAQRFAGGLLLQYTAGPLAGRAFVVSGAIGARYTELGGAAGVAGAPLGDEFQASGVFRQEFEGATLEFTQGTPVRVIEKLRRPTLTVTPSSVLPGGRYRVSIGGFPPNSRLRITQGGLVAPAFDASSATGAYVYETAAPPDARSGVVVLRATDLATTAPNPPVFAEGSFNIRTLAELRPQIQKISGDIQSGAPAAILNFPLRIQLRDANQNPLAAVPVRFESSPGGAVVSASALTDADGFAEATWRLPPQAGIALLSVQSAGQTASFSARAAATTIAAFPRLSQAVEGNLGNSALPLARRASLLAALASVARFYQQRGLAPLDSGLADVAVLNNYLRAYCAPDAAGTQICDGFLDLGAGTDPVPNPLRLTNFSSGALELEILPPNLDSIRQAIVADSPVIVALELNPAGSPPFAHFVTAIGVEANGDITVADSTATFARSTLSQYLNGLTVAGAPWQGKLVSAFRYGAAGARSTAFYAFANSSFDIGSASPSCGPPLVWPATVADPTTTPLASSFRLIACDGNGGSYQADVPAPFLLILNSNSNPARQSVASAATPAAYAIARDPDSWALTPQTLTLSSSGVVNGATFQPGFAPGVILTLFGAGLPRTATAGQSVQWNGQDLPIFFSNGFQLNTALPGNAETGLGTLRVASAFGQQSLALDLAEAAPGIFTLGNQSAAIVNQDGTLNSPLQPAQRGQAIVIYCTGLGPTREDGAGLRPTVAPTSVFLDGLELRPFFSGLTPGFIGLYQVNVTMPQSLPPGLRQNLNLRIGGVSSPNVPFSLR